MLCYHHNEYILNLVIHRNIMIDISNNRTVIIVFKSIILLLMSLLIAAHVTLAVPLLLLRLAYIRPPNYYEQHIILTVLPNMEKRHCWQYQPIMFHKLHIDSLYELESNVNNRYKKIIELAVWREVALLPRASVATWQGHLVIAPSHQLSPDKVQRIRSLLSLCSLSLPTPFRCCIC